MKDVLNGRKCIVHVNVGVCTALGTAKAFSDGLNNANKYGQLS